MKLGLPGSKERMLYELEKERLEFQRKRDEYSTSNDDYSPSNDYSSKPTPSDKDDDRGPFSENDIWKP